MRLDGKVAVITGAARGIGRAIAAEMINEGAHVMLTDRDGAAAKRTAHELAATGGIIQAFRLDVTDRLQVNEATAAIPPRPHLTFDLDVDVCVIGAGLSGLTTAYAVARRGWSGSATSGRK